MFSHHVSARSKLPKSTNSPQHRAILCQSASTTQQQSLTEKIFTSIRDDTQQAGGAGGQTLQRLTTLRNVDASWAALRSNSRVFGLRPEFVKTTATPLPSLDYDVVVAGGTLGIFMATALAKNGLKVAVLERGPLIGRTQEWNISYKELLELVKAEVLTEDEIHRCTETMYNPGRVGFAGSCKKDILVKDILNIGVSPALLIEKTKAKFIEYGGIVMENTALSSIWVHPNGSSLMHNNSNNSSSRTTTARLTIDAMGNASPIIKQVRHGTKPDGVCIVVGSCARGFDSSSNTTGDIIYTNAPSDVELKCQMYWEAFPASLPPPSSDSTSSSTERTTYMFTYLDGSETNPSIEQLFETYFQSLPQYQAANGISNLDDLEFLRLLYGVFPTYRASPLRPSFRGILAIGDASGIQSPLSFGGFGAICRHINRLTAGITEAVDAGMLDEDSLSLLNPYNPALSGSWMMQRAMSIPGDRTTRDIDRDFINKLLAGNFAAMEELGDPVLRPFLQDIIQLKPLSQTLLKQVIDDPLFVIQIFRNVGLYPLADWLVHYIGLATFTGLALLSRRFGWYERAELLPVKQKFLVKRTIESWVYGSGLDYEL
jgi:lycopene cyclase CruP